jgi:hypothetical protein
MASGSSARFPIQRIGHSLCRNVDNVSNVMKIAGPAFRYGGD